jgi:DNA-binding MarR family transcriptional regulator
MIEHLDRRSVQHRRERVVRLSRDRRTELLRGLWGEARRFQAAQEAVDDAAYGRLGLNRSDGRALDALDRHGGLTAGALARETGLSTGATTTMLDRLEAAGLVRRVRDEADRRRVLVEITDRAVAHLRDVWEPIARDAGEGLTGYSDEDLALITRFLRFGRETLGAHVERLHALPPPARPGG